MESTIQNRYEKLSLEREPYLKRARECALYTLPWLFPPKGSNQHSILKKSYQSVASEGVNNLVSKLLLSLMPPNTPFFRQDLDPKAVSEVFEAKGEQAAQELLSKITKALSMREALITKYIEASSDRNVVGGALKHVLVGGNALLFLPAKRKMRMYRLDSYVVRRSPEGEPVEYITKEVTSWELIPAAVKALLPQMAMHSDKRDVSIFTRTWFDGSEWKTVQEVEGIKIPDSEGSYPKDYCPYIALRFTVVDGEDYGRSFIENHIGDIQVLEGLSKSLTEASAAAARVVGLVDPNASTNVRDLNRAKNGEFTTGHKDDVTFLQVNKASDFQFTDNFAIRIEKRLQRVFLMFQGSQRDAERVTTTEIRALINSIEEQNGGFYSLFAQEFQQPYIRLKIRNMEQEGKLDKLKGDDAISLTIVTGLEALGRSQELQKMQAYFEVMQGIYGTNFAQYTKPEAVSEKVATALQMDDSGIVKTQDELAQEQQETQSNTLVNATAPQMVQAGGKLLQERMRNEQQQQTA